MPRAIVASMFVVLLAADASADSFVILRRETPLFVAPDPAARTLRGSRKDSAELARWRLVARNDAFVEIESVPETFDSVVFEGQPASCILGENHLERYELRLFVRAADLQTVLTRGFEKRHRDGTGIRHVAGNVVSDDVRAALAIPASSLGDSFEPQAFAPAAGRTIERVEGTVGGKKTALRSATVVAIEPRGRGALVTVRDPCREVVVKVADRRRLVEERDRGVPGPPGFGGPHLPAGTTLTHEEGGFAGTVREPLALDALADRVEKGDRLCWSVELAEPLRLCADRIAVTSPSDARAPAPPTPPKLHAAAGWPVVNDLDARQLRGEAYHTPQPDPELFDELRARGEEQRIAIGYKVCVDGDGKVAEVFVTRPSGFTTFDRQVATYIERAWRYAPARDGAGACTRIESVFMPPIDIDLRSR